MYYKIKTNSLDIRKVLKNEYSKNNLEENKEENKNEVPEMPNIRFSPEREAELMRELYAEINTALYHFVLQVLDEYEFKGSILYNNSGIDRETISQMVDRIINLAEKNIDQIGEIKLNRTPISIKYWDSWALLRSTIESLLLNDIFGIRRPEYFKMINLDILK